MGFDDNPLNLYELEEIIKGDRAEDKLKEIAEKVKWYYVEMGLDEETAQWIFTGMLGGYQFAVQIIENYIHELEKRDEIIPDLDEEKAKEISDSMKEKIKKMKEDGEI